MYELLIGAVVAIAAGLVGAWIFAKGQKVGADIVWRVAENKPPLFDAPPPDMEEMTTEEMDINAANESDEIEDRIVADSFGFAQIDGTR